jgi:hypothetical protein
MKYLMTFSLALIVAACAQNERKAPVTELPNKPKSASMACESLTDKEVISCLNGADTREVCRKVEYNCAVLRNLQSFVDRTWQERDGK